MTNQEVRFTQPVSLWPLDGTNNSPVTWDATWHPDFYHYLPTSQCCWNCNLFIVNVNISFFFIHTALLDSPKLFSMLAHSHPAFFFFLRWRWFLAAVNVGVVQMLRKCPRWKLLQEEEDLSQAPSECQDNPCVRATCQHTVISKWHYWFHVMTVYFSWGYYWKCSGVLCAALSPSIRMRYDSSG